jgi:hypothetical protein
MVFLIEGEYQRRFVDAPCIAASATMSGTT